MKEGVDSESASNAHLAVNSRLAIPDSKLRIWSDLFQVFF